MAADSDADRGREAVADGGVSASDAVERQLEEFRRQRNLGRLVRLAVFGVIAVAFYAATFQIAGATNLDGEPLSAILTELINFWPGFVAGLSDYFPPTSYFGVPFVDLGQYYAFWQSAGLLGQAFITLAMAIAGTVLGAPLALLFGVLGSERVIPFPFNFLFRGLMSIIRSIPSLVWALIYVPLGGVSPLTATLAIGTDTIGTLGRLLTDELEEVEDGTIEGVSSTGAGKVQTIVFGMISQVIRPFIAWTMYILEINVRAAVGLGIIGGGGIGLTLRLEQQTFKFTNMMATILFIVVLVISVEAISQRTRSYLRQGDDGGDTMSLYELLVGFPERMSDALLRSR